MTKILEEIMKLSTEEQMQLADAIYRNVSQDFAPHSINSEEEKEWLRKKLEDQAKTPGNVTSWEEMEARILKRL